MSSSKAGILILFLAFIQVANAQSFKYRKESYTWAEEKPAEIPVEKQYANEDAVILDEKVIYSAWGYRVPSYAYLAQNANYFYIDRTSQGLSPMIQKHVRMKFLTAEGIRKYAKIVLPESLDPTSDISNVRMEWRDTLIRPRGQFECINHFAARILKADGTITNAVFYESTQKEISRVNGIDEKLYNWIFQIVNLEPGDELELDYSYTGVFNIDPSTRIIFNGDLPKQNFHLTFRFPEKSTYILTYHNGAEPYDSIMVTRTSPHNTEYYFSKKNLMGGIREPGGRPHMQLPYFTFYEHKRDFGISDSRGFVTMPLPYPWKYAMIPWGGFQYDNLKVRMKRLDGTTRTLNRFVEAEKAKCKDTAFAAIVSSIQHTLSDEFSYQDDSYAVQAGDNRELENLGPYVESKTLRATSRMRLYKEVIDRFDREYFAAPLFDKRVSSMDPERFEYLTTMRWVFAAIYKSNVIYYYPKSCRSGLEANELPFYYEDVNTALVSQYAPSEERKSMFPDFKTFFVRTPFSEAQDNTRSSSVKVTASLASLQTKFNAEVKLSGQFSTLTRGYYLYGCMDTTVNSEYYNILSDLDGHQQVKWEVTSAATSFPYETVLTAGFNGQDSIQRKNDGTFSIPLEYWFNQVIEEDFTAERRHLDFYPDFRCIDVHKYTIQFDKGIQLENADALQRYIDNSFAQLSIQVKQVSDNSIMLGTSYTVKPTVVSASDAKDVDEVFKAIKALRNSELTFRIR